MSMDSLVSMQNVDKNFRDMAVFHQLNISLQKGKTVMIGPNGTGKSTFLKICYGISSIQSGKASVMGYDTFSERNDLKRKVAYLPAEAVFPPGLTVESILDYVSTFCSANRIDQLASGLDAASLKRKVTRTLSSGERQIVNLIWVLSQERQFYLLDEPTASLDRDRRRQFIDILRETHESVLVTSHEYNELFGAVDFICQLHRITGSGQSVFSPVLKARETVVKVMFFDEQKAVNHLKNINAHFSIDGDFITIYSELSEAISGLAGDIVLMQRDIDNEPH